LPAIQFVFFHNNKISRIEIEILIEKNKLFDLQFFERIKFHVIMIFFLYRLGNHVCPKDNQQLIVARFDQQGNELIRNDLDTLFSQNRTPIINTSRASPTNTSRESPTHSSTSESANCSGSSTPQRTSSPFPVSQQSMYRNAPLFTPPRALSPQAPVFQMTTSAPINVPLKPHPLENSIDSMEENSPSDGNNSQPDRSDTPQSMHSTTSNESTDSGYCGYVESYPCKIDFFIFKIMNKLFFSFSRLLQIESII
jgi:hypothetical protein